MDRAQLAKDLRRDEGFRAHVYQDHLGYDTIGYGFLVDQRRGGGLPKEVAEFWLGYNLTMLAGELDQRLPWLRNQPEEVQRALHNMAYQLGAAGLMKFERMLAALQAGDRAEAKRQALDSKWARDDTPVRARRVAKLIGPD